MAATAVMAAAACGGGPTAEPVVCSDGGVRVEGDGGAFCAYPRDAGPEPPCPEGEALCVADDGAGSCAPAGECPALGCAGFIDEIVLADDGGRMERLATTAVEVRTWPSGGQALIPRDGDLWWLHSTDTCPHVDRKIWWGVRATRFTPAADGRAVDVVDDCEPGSDGGYTLRALALGDSIVHCWTVHHPLHEEVCGVVGAEPGATTHVMRTGLLRVGPMGGFGDRLAVVARHLETNERALETLDLSTSERRSIPLKQDPARGESWLVGTADAYWIARSAVAGAPLRLERVAHDGAVLPAIEVSRPDLGAASISPGWPAGLPSGDGIAFVSSVVGEDAAPIYLSRVAADGSHCARRISPDTTARALLSPYAGGFLALLRADRSEEREIALLRLTASGLLLEPPLVVETGPDVLTNAIAVDGDRAWLILSRGVANQQFGHEIVSVSLP